MLIEDINQIYDQEYKIKNIQTKEDKTEIQIQATYLYSSFENETINKQETIITKEISANYELNKIKLEIAKDCYLTQLIRGSSSPPYTNIKYSKLSPTFSHSYSIRSDICLASNIFLAALEDENKINIGDKIYIPRAI